MKSETLQRLITIERNTPTRDAFNEEVDSWAQIIRTRAYWRHATANEQLAAQEIQAAYDAIFEIRWSTIAATVDAKDRIKFNGRIFNIVDAYEIGRREGIRIRATARTD